MALDGQNVRMLKISESTHVPNWSSSKTNERSFDRVRLKLLCLEVCNVKTSLVEELEVQTACFQLAFLFILFLEARLHYGASLLLICTFLESDGFHCPAQTFEDLRI